MKLNLNNMKLFKDGEVTAWAKIELCFQNDENFIEQFDKVFDFHESEYKPDAGMKFYIEINGEDIWVEINQDGGMDGNLDLKIDGEEIDLEENTAECILKAIKNNLIK